jgi:multidrug efflux system membrane fusion protein
MFGTASAGCSLAKREKSEKPPPTITVSYPVQREVSDYAVYTGRTAAVKSVTIVPRATGYLEKMPFKEGADVKEGDLLFQIDPRPYEALVNQAKAQIALNEAQLKYSKSVLERDLAAKQANAVSLNQIDQDQSTVDQNAASVVAAKANLAVQELNLTFTRVTSPIDGRVSSYYLTLGNLAVQDQSRLTTVVSQDPIYAYFDADEPTVIRIRDLIREGKLHSIQEASQRIPVWLALSNEEGYPHEGYLDFVNNEFTASTATLRVRGVFANPRPAVGDRLLSPAMFVRVRVQVGPPRPAVLIAQGSVGTDQDVSFVYVLNDRNEVVRRTVKLGMVHDGLQEIQDGVSAAERVVVTGLQRVRPGLVVTPELKPMPVPVRSESQSPRLDLKVPLGLNLKK